MVDKKAITEQFYSWFDADGVEFEVNEDGTISGEGTIYTNKKFPAQKLPLRFKNFTGSFWLMHANLHILEGLPEIVDGDLRLRGNQLSDLKGGPKIVTGTLNILENPLESLAGFPNSVDKVILHDDPKLPMLRLLNANEISIHGSRDPNYRVLRILQKYQGQGKRAAHLCAKELISAGLEENAKW